MEKYRVAVIVGAATFAAVVMAVLLLLVPQKKEKMQSIYDAGVLQIESGYFVEGIKTMRQFKTPYKDSERYIDLALDKLLYGASKVTGETTGGGQY